MIFRALILAGQRSGIDPVAAAHHQQYKVQVPILGQPMLRYVIDAIRAVPGLEKLYIMSNDRDVALNSGAACEWLAPGSSPAASFNEAIEAIGLDKPLLVTTGDHPLLTKAMIEHLLEHSPADSDLTVGLASANDVLAKYPGAVRTYYRFGGKGYSGCNLFFARAEAAKGIIRYWQEMEQLRKRPLHLVRKIGYGILFRYLFGMISLDQAFAYLSTKTGSRIAPVLLPMPEAAIDVDKPEDLILARQILEARH